MITFLFWNLKRRPLEAILATLAHAHQIDVIILAETEIAEVDLLEALNVNRTVKYALTFNPSRRVTILTRFPHYSIKPISDSGGISIRRFSPPIGIDVILVAVHLSSKLYQDTSDQALAMTRIARLITETEAKVGHRRTVVVGDLNMNPFEVGLVGAEALHAVMTRVIARKNSRYVEGEKKYFFYNPMWAHFGERGPGPPGTYYLYSSRQVNYFWNIFDQVLIRPGLLDRFNDEDVKVLTTAGDLSLVKTDGTPNDHVGSDHLPLLFRLDLERAGV